MFINPLGVFFYLDTEGSITIVSGYPGHEVREADCNFWKIEDFNTIDIYKKYLTIGDFIDSLSITGIGDLEQLSPSQLLGYYEKGILEISCYVEKKGIGCHLIFRKKYNKLYAFESETENEFEVLKPLTKAIDFLSYSAKYANCKTLPQFLHHCGGN